MSRPPVWQMIKEAIEALGGKATYGEIRDYIKAKFGDVNKSTITCQTIICSVNHPSRVHYPENKDLGGRPSYLIIYMNTKSC